MARDYEPKVLVQIPMRNEWTCFKRGIAAACRLDWPADKLEIQVRAASAESGWFLLAFRTKVVRSGRGKPWLCDALEDLLSRGCSFFRGCVGWGFDK